MRRWLPALGIFLGLIASSANACNRDREIEEFLLFGNSFFDTGAGNAVAAAEGLPLPSPTPPWFLGRHSNGPIWIDFSSCALQMPVENFAISGAETGNGNFSEPGLGGLFQQVQRFTQQEKKIKSDTLVIMDGGGNDFFSLLNNPSDLNPAGVEATIVQAITNLSQVFTQLQALGAKKIVMWNLGDLGSLPLFTDPALGLTALQPLFSGASVAFNTALLELIQTFNRFSKDQQQIYLFDAFDVFNQVTAQLVAQGVNPTEHTITTFPDGSFLITGPQPDRLEFYDQAHPTTFAWKTVSRFTSAYLDTLINGPRFVAAQQDLVFAVSSAHTDAVENHFRALHAQHYIYESNWTDCGLCECGRIQVYGDIGGKWGTTPTRDSAMGLEFDTQLLMLGADYFWDNCTTVGVSFTGQTSWARAKNCGGHMRLNTFVPTIYASHSDECYFIDLSTSYHFLDFRKIHRRIHFLNIKAGGGHMLDTKARGHQQGQAFQSTAQLGYVSQCGDLTLMPIIGLDFENICLRGYTERGANLLDQKMRRQHQNSLLTKVGAQVFWDGLGGCLVPFVELYYEYQCLRNRHTIGPRLFRVNDRAINFHRVGAGRRNFLKYSVGFEAVLSECVSGNLSYEGETNFKNCNNSVRAELAASF